MNQITKQLAPGARKTILYMTDYHGVQSGYEYAWTQMMAKAGIRKAQVRKASIYTLIPNPMVKYRNEKTLRFDPSKRETIQHAFDQKVRAIQPDAIIISDPALLGLFTGWDQKSATLAKLRGGRYDYNGIPVVISLPISAINTNVDERTSKDLDGENIPYEPYKVKQGAWVLQRDWEKLGRIIHGISFKRPTFEYSVCRTIDEIKAAKRWLDDCVFISTDVETGSYPAQITCIGFTGLRRDGACRSFVIPFIHQFKDSGLFWDDQSDHAAAWQLTRRILNNPVPKAMHNGFYDASYFLKYRLGITNYAWDSMVLWWSLYMELPKTLDFVSSILLDDYQYWKDDIKGVENDESSAGAGLEGYWRYNALDCHNTLWNSLRLMQLLEGNERMRKAYEDAMIRVMSGTKMSMAGVRADFKKRDGMRIKLEALRAERLERFRHMIDDPEFNVESPDQKCSLIYDVLGAKPRNAKGRPATAKKGDGRSSGAVAMKAVKADHPYFAHIINALQDTMEPQKQIANVMNIKLQTSRFRCAYNAIGTDTTRYSSKKSNFWDGTNAQNIRKEFRSWLVADSGCVLMDIDYSQSDDVFMGYEANDPHKIQVIESGLDGHCVHGELFFKVPYADLVAGKKSDDPKITHPLTGIRSIAKRIVHGTNFQMAAMTLYLTMGREPVVAAARLLGYPKSESMSQEQLVEVCGRLMLTYRKKYPRFTKKEFYAEILAMLRNGGVVTNAFGIGRKFLGDPEDNGTQREATGFIGQSDTAGNMNRAQKEIDWGVIPKTFRDGPNPCANERPLQMNWESHGMMFLLQTHDSFTIQFDTNHPKWKEAAHNVLHVMERPVIINGHTVRIKTEAEFGLHWGKGMLPWDSKNPYDLDRIVASL